MLQYRQGDVLLTVIKSIPKTAKPVPRDNGRVVLAYGEVTGHAHAFQSSRATMYRDDGGTYLLIDGDAPADLQHEEHDTIKVPPRNYRVTRQVEYPRGELQRQVAD